ncbi:MAG: methyltransferase domain-containing protein, partial [Anaerovorax sp.]
AYGDGEFLDGFLSHSFDGVMMECVLSLINLPDEALHEAYCVLKKGGKLFISDLYIKDPQEDLVKALSIEAERKSKMKHDEGACDDNCQEDHKERVVNFRLNGRFLQQQLVNQLEEMGYKNIVWQDYSKELGSYVAEKIMAGGNHEDCFCLAMDEKNTYKTGYFLLVAEK